MTVYLVWYATDVAAVFTTWEKASQFIDKELECIEADTGYRPVSDFTIDEWELL